MARKTVVEYETKERRETVHVCDFNDFHDSENSTIFQLPISPVDSEYSGTLCICGACLTTHFGYDDFEYVDSIEESPRTGIQVNVIEMKQVPRSVALVIGGIPLFAVLVFIGICAIVFNPGPIAWTVIAIFSAILYSSSAMAIADNDYDLNNNGVVKEEIKRK